MYKASKILIKQGYSVIPCNKNKEPAIKEWAKHIYFPIKEAFDCEFMGLLMGGAKKLTTIDIDLKYDETGTLYEELKSLIPNKILKKLRVHSTKNGGYHFIFSCAKVESNKKWAMRPTTEKEREERYLLERAKGRTFTEAMQTASSYKALVLIETRGEGGYIIIPPSEGYEVVYGSINELTVEEYDKLESVCRSFNRYIVPVSPPKNRDDLTKIAEYNKINNKNIPKILESFGWEQTGVNNKGYMMFRRPGADSSHSAFFNEEDGGFWVKSTSTPFEIDRRYSAADIVFTLKFDNNPDLYGEFLNYLDEK